MCDLKVNLIKVGKIARLLHHGAGGCAGNAASPQLFHSFGWNFPICNKQSRLQFLVFFAVLEFKQHFYKFLLNQQSNI